MMQKQRLIAIASLSFLACIQLACTQNNLNNPLTATQGPGGSSPSPTPIPTPGGPQEVCANVDTVSTAQPLPKNNFVPTIIKTPFWGNGHTETWDGRVFIVTRNLAQPPPAPIGWFVSAFRPENVTTSNGIPQFGDNTFSEPFQWEFDFAPGSEMTWHNTLALVPAPGFAENPFKSDANGTPQKTGSFETYEALIYITFYDLKKDANGNYETDAAGNRILIDQWLGSRRARIIVSQPRTAQATVSKAVFLEPFRELHTLSGKRIHGMEPTATFDGRLLIYQGHPLNNSTIDRLMYVWNTKSGTTDGWSEPQTISNMYYLDRDKLIDGIPFHEHYPIAKEPLKDSTGRPFTLGEHYIGAYPWISHDGTEIFHTAIVAGCGEGIAGCPPERRERARRGGESVIGRWTGYTLKHIDGPINPDRLATNTTPTVRLLFSSPGAFGTMWAPYREMTNLPFPYTHGRPTYPIFGSNTNDYNEVSFEDHEDTNYVLFLRMNEMVYFDTTRKKPTDPIDLNPDFKANATQTADTSGNFNTGFLENAKFPQEYNSFDGNVGISGQAIYFPDRGLIRVKKAVSHQKFDKGFTAQMWVKRLVDISGDGENRYRFLMNKPGIFDIILEESGQVQATVYVVQPNGSIVSKRSGATNFAIPLNQWTHVATSYEPTTGALRVYINGVKHIEMSFPALQLASSNTDLIIGPGEQVTPLWPNTNEALMLIDDVRLSNIVRQDFEISISSFLPQPNNFNQPNMNLPLGLKASDLKIPKSNPISDKATKLGNMLFFEKRLSKNKDMACVTCHKPGTQTADGLIRALGDGGKTLRRNTPPIFNRAFSTLQFWDGRAQSLEDQAVIPIESPVEMNLPINDAVLRLNAIPDYVTLFQQAFGQGPTRETIGKALASFQRTLLSGNSRADRFENGDSNALTDSEIKGRLLFQTKARCIACHTGSTFSDEGFHNTAFTCGTDLGLEEITGKPRDRRLFKTPTLRDIALTAPYLHDGRMATLEDVVEFYNRGGLGRENRDSEIRPLGLSPEEKANLISYLKALT